MDCAGVPSRNMSRRRRKVENVVLANAYHPCLLKDGPEVGSVS
jgi:hypothetical protein